MSNSDELAVDAYRSAVAAVTAYLGAFSGSVPMTEVAALVAAVAPPEVLVLPLCALVLRAAEMAALTATDTGHPSTVGDVLAALGAEAASLSG